MKSIIFAQFFGNPTHFAKWKQFYQFQFLYWLKFPLTKMLCIRSLLKLFSPTDLLKVDITEKL